MGDADSHIILPAEEIDAWMDDALEEMDNGLNTLYSFMNAISQRTAHVQSELRVYQKNLRYFTSTMSIFVCPVILAVGIAYFANALTDESRGIDVSLTMTIALLMFVSFGIGLPIYIYAFCLFYMTHDEKESLDLLRARSVRTELTNFFDWESRLAYETEPSRMSVEYSLDELSELGRKVNKRIRDNVRSDLERRIIQTGKIHQESGRSSNKSEDDENPESCSEEGETIRYQEKVELGREVDDLSGFRSLGADELSETETMIPNEEGDVQPIIPNSISDLYGDIEKKDEILPRAEDKQEHQVEENMFLNRKEIVPRLSVCNTTVEKVGEGEWNAMFSRGDEDAGDKAWEYREVMSQ